MVALVGNVQDQKDPRAAQFDRMVEFTYLPDDRMPYHGRSHVTEVRQNAKAIVQRCYDKGVAVDVVALDRAITLHDALMHVDPKFLGFRSAEEMAARLAYNFMVHSGYPQFEAQRVERIILATNPSVRPTTTEEIVMRAADLWNVGGPYEGFSKGTLRLHREAEIRRGEPLAVDTWTAGSYGYLKLFLWPMLELTPNSRDDAGRSIWHTNAMSNMTRFWREVVSPRGKVVAEVIDEKYGATLPAGEQSSFYIALHENESLREKLVQGLPPTLPNKSVACVIPGKDSALPLPDSCCDELIISEFSLPAVREAFRVVRNDGRLLFRLPTEGNHPPESGPTPPGFVFETFRDVGGAKCAVFAKNGEATPETAAPVLPPMTDSLRGWAKALSDVAPIDLPKRLVEELRATMAERYAKLEREGLLSIPVTSLSAEMVLKDPTAAMGAVGSNEMFVFIEPKDRDSALPRWRGKASETQLEEKVRSVIGKNKPDDFMVTLQRHYHILYNANIIVKENGEMTAEFCRGDDLPSRMGAQLLFTARRDPLTDLFSYSTGSSTERGVAYTVMQAIPGEGEGRDRKYKPGYYEVAVAQISGSKGMLPLFFDYRTHRFFTGESHGQSAASGD